MFYVTKALYTPELLRLNPEVLFVFGDNAARWGQGGQALIRDEPNAIGLATKVSPLDYFLDGPHHYLIINHDITAIKHLAMHHDVILPVAEDGTLNLGTGLSAMPTQCPKLFLHLIEQLPVQDLEEYQLKTQPLFETHVLWGEQPDEDGSTAQSYKFNTEPELNAFLHGVDEAIGWLGYQNYDTNAELQKAIKT